ncbi:NAD(P)-dependent oxidoreductase [Nocardioides sp. 31GB23]|uniref:NAD-dependent epimerase/dehydratase family protein n=1 Tax=Nocardioides sp. 31GB23 TaxID=3156065 RepID=UPI0032AE8227
MIVIWGGTGFIGLHTAAELIEQGEQVVLTTYSRHRETPYLRAAVERGDAVLEPVDLRDADSVMAVADKYRPTSMIDISGYPPKEMDPADEVRSRVANYVNVLEAARKLDVERLTMTSSFDVYYGLPQTKLPYREDEPVPLQESEDHFIVQSWAKKTLESIASMYRRQQDLDIVTVRPAGAFGPMYRTFLNVPSRMVRAAVKGDEPTFPREPDGRPRADFGYDQLYVKDIARAIAGLHLKKDLAHPVYNIGSGEVLTNEQILHAVQAAVPGFDYELAQTPADEPPALKMVVDVTRLRDELGFEPRYSVTEAIGEYAEWLREHEL